MLAGGRPIVSDQRKLIRHATGSTFERTTGGIDMALIDEIKVDCDRLAPKGWQRLLLDVTGGALNISQPTAAALMDELTKPLPNIDRSRAGFEDFNPRGNRAADSGDPSKSLLYHALASPSVHPTTDNQPSSVNARYPKLEELDRLENFIFSLAAGRRDLDDTFVAVFAYQYRPGNRTTHLTHADMAYSRTGVARVGTARENYDASRRSFWVLPRDNQDEICVLPARYGAFLARVAKPGIAGTVQGGHRGLADDDFVFPVHKLFDGPECLEGQNLDLEFHEFHRNEKLRKVHALPVSEGGMPLPRGFDPTRRPFVRDSGNGGRMVRRKAAGSSVVITPIPSDTLTQTAVQRNSIAGTDQLVHFNVPPVQRLRQRLTRYRGSSLEIPGFGGDRLAPEYVNIRHRIDPDGPVDQVPEDLNQLSDAAFLPTLAAGGYAAAHFIDNSCDGAVEVFVGGLDGNRPNIPAFSLVTAPDFFPLADQIEVERGAEIRRARPLSKGRLPVNTTLPRPLNQSVTSFTRSDRTVTAIVGGFGAGPNSAFGPDNRMVSFLPDGASDIFAPGWDVSRGRDNLGPMLTSSGLGSPFPEDAKLCAALASFWPAVAPDNGRTFGNVDGLGTELPMLDEELGFHPRHELVVAGLATSTPGWDGEFGPFYEVLSGTLHVNFVDLARSDYVVHALEGNVSVKMTAVVQSRELIARFRSFSRCNRVMRLRDRDAPLCLVSVRKVNDWAAEGPGSAALRGEGYLMDFAELENSQSSTGELKRVRREVNKRHICHVGSNGIAYKEGGRAFTFRPV